MLLTLAAGWVSALMACGLSGGGGAVGNAPGDSNDNATTRIALSDPMGVGSADPEKSVDRKLYVILHKFSVLCVYEDEHRVRFKAEGRLHSKDGEDRIVRVVSPSDKTYIDLLADQQYKHGYISFTGTAGYRLSFKIYIMPKDFVPGPLNTALPCENGACKKGGKKPMTFISPDFCCNGDLCPLTDPGQLENAPACIQVEEIPELQVQKSDPIPHIETQEELNPMAGQIPIGLSECL